MKDTPVHILNLETKEITLITEVINHHPEKDINGLVRVLRFIYNYEIKPEHYLALGYLIGEKTARHFAQSNNLNILTLCQKQN